MPLLKIQTNIALENAQQQALLTQASKQLAEALGKPERYVMVALQPQSQMSFGRTDDPVAYLELKSIGLPETKTAELSAMLCNLMAGFNIPADRVYIEFADAPRKMWGWNGGTF